MWIEDLTKALNFCIANIIKKSNLCLVKNLVAIFGHKLDTFIHEKTRLQLQDQANKWNHYFSIKIKEMQSLRKNKIKTCGGLHGNVPRKWAGLDSMSKDMMMMMAPNKQQKQKLIIHHVDEPRRRNGLRRSHRRRFGASRGGDDSSRAAARSLEVPSATPLLQVIPAICIFLQIPLLASFFHSNVDHGFPLSKESIL